MREGRARRLETAASLAAVLVLLGCSSFGMSRRPSTWFRSAAARASDPWKLPSTAYPTQRLYRVRYEGPEGRLGFKLTLYLEGEERFRMRAADGLGRRIWELDVDENDKALWLDHRNKMYCTLAAASDVAVVPLARLPLASLPKLLLGHLPSTPASDLRLTKASVYYRDGLGQLWNGGLSDGRLEWWTLVDQGEATTWWRREGEESVFVDLRGEQQVRWREIVREPLATGPAPLTIPEKYEDADCS